MVAGYVKELNAKLNRWETIKKFTVLPRDLTIENGEMTPSLKVKRRGVEDNFRAEIDKMYEGTLAEL
jgi:long-chain acyl-CoA synthetase